MKGREKLLFIAVASIAVIASFFFVAHTIFANTVTSSVTVGNAAPTVPTIVLNNASSVVLTANTTTPVDVYAIVSDNNGCSDLTGGTTTIVLYRSGVGASCAADDLNCYRATAFTASSSCSGTSINTTTTFNMQYFAQATDASSSYSSENWVASVSFTDPAGSTGNATTGQELLTLNAINITTSSIDFGAQSASSTTGATNQTTTVQNAGNSSSTLDVSGTAFVSGANNFATSSQHYATSTFTYNTNDTALSDVPTSISGFILTAPTTTSRVESTIYWGVGVPSGVATGTYNATTTFTSIFSS